MNEYEKEELAREESELGRAQLESDGGPEPDMGPEELTQAVPEPEIQPEAFSPVELEYFQRGTPPQGPESFRNGNPPQGRQSRQEGPYQQNYHNYQQNYQQQYPQYPPYPPPPSGAFGGPTWPQYGPNTTGWQQPQWQQPGGYRPQQAPASHRKKPARSAEFDGGSDDVAPVKKKKKRGPFRVLLRLMAALLVLALVAGTGYSVYAIATGDNPLSGRLVPGEEAVGGPSGGSNTVPDVVINDRPQGADRYDGSEEGTLSNTAIFNKVSPSVVGVVARMGDSFYGDSSQGSGIIMSEDGYIITNAHVVEGAVSYEVVLTDGESYPAQLVGADRNSDLAVLKVNETGLAFAEFGNSDQSEVGERVCVIGNPGGLRFQNSLTVGYLSALKRTINTGGYSIDCLQTDAAVNPGNSGGPLINAYGQVIGITSAKIALSGYEGICFAIPISDAMPILKQLIADGKVTGRAMLGITAQAVRASEAEFYEIPMGLWVKSITPGSDIGAKGVREGDIITHIEDTPIYSLDACTNVLKNYKPGDTVTITVFRRESSMTDNTFKVEIVLQGS